MSGKEETIRFKKGDTVIAVKTDGHRLKKGMRCRVEGVSKDGGMLNVRMLTGSNKGHLNEWYAWRFKRFKKRKAMTVKI